jgi:putative tryptophan/tyrosine transport system substrate-binding protein
MTHPNVQMKTPLRGLLFRSPAMPLLQCVPRAATGGSGASLALAAHLPTMLSTRESVEAGGLMTYGPNFPDLFRRAGDYVDKILHGAKPEDIPVEQPTKFNLIINLTTAKALGLTVPESFLARADEVIE